jgi:hypothetical protein
MARRDQACGQDLLVVIDVGQKTIDGGDPLHQATLQERPFIGRDDARHHIRWNQPLGIGVIAIDREGNADTPKQQIGFRTLGRHLFRGHGIQPGGIRGIVPARALAGVEHLVVNARGGRQRLGRRGHHVLSLAKAIP